MNKLVVDLGVIAGMQHAVDEACRFLDWHNEVDLVSLTYAHSNLSTCFRRGRGSPVALESTEWDSLGIPYAEYDPNWLVKANPNHRHSLSETEAMGDDV